MDYLKGLTNGLQLLAGDAQTEQTGLAETHLPAWWSDVQLLLRNVVPHHVRIDWDCPADLPPLRVPPVALTQIVFNLLQHCGQALMGRPGAWIQLRVRRIRAQSAVRLRVRYNGPPLDESEVKAAAGAGTFGERPPRGLGLPVAFALTERAGGDISVGSGPNRDTVFNVRLAVAGSRGPYFGLETLRVTPESTPVALEVAVDHELE
jgi:C4-dicarboxylate-specific signal transduction histidine kinase